MKALLSIVLLALAAFLGAKFGGDSPRSASAIDQELNQTGNEAARPISDQSSGLEADLVSISQTEMQEYNQLKDQKAKYDKANEILGKIMLVFLADLGLRLERSKDLLKSSELPAKSSLPTKSQSPPPVESNNRVTEFRHNKQDEDRRGRVAEREKSRRELRREFRESLSAEERRERRRLANRSNTQAFQLKENMVLRFSGDHTAINGPFVLNVVDGEKRFFTFVQGGKGISPKALDVLQPYCVFHRKGKHLIQNINYFIKSVERVSPVPSGMVGFHIEIDHSRLMGFGCFRLPEIEPKNSLGRQFKEFTIDEIIAVLGLQLSIYPF